jgi:hypothetical protein
MKRGIALLITMGFITVLTGIIAYMFSITGEVFDEAIKVDARNQRTILLKDIKVIVSRYAQDVENSDDLSNFLLGMPPFYDKKSDTSLHIEIGYLSNKVNINSLFIRNKVDKNVVEFLKNIGETYNVLDIGFFIALLEDTIDRDDVSRQALSEISREDIKFSNSRIISFGHFKKIVEYYVKTTQDTNILAIPWEKLIYFGELQKEVVDCDKMSKELINAFRLSVEDFTGCVDLEDEESKKIAKKFNLKPFFKMSNLYVLVNISYQVNDFKDEVFFIYDLKTKEIK